MGLKVAINGFGRIGRLALREILANYNDIEIVAINSRTNADMLVHLFKYDSLQGSFVGHVELMDNQMIVNGKKIQIFAEENPAKLPWNDLKIDVVLECTGAFTTSEKAKIHLQAGAKKVLISAPADKETKTVVFNVNHQILNNEDSIISGASCTTNCLAPMAKVLNDSFGIVQGLMTTIHAYTGDQNTLDASHRKNDKRRARAAAVNIVPNSTGAAKAIGLVIPELKGRLDGSAQRVPVAVGSLTELVTILQKTVKVDQINQAMKSASNESFGYTDDPIVSSDVIGIRFGSLFDATQTNVLTVGNQQLIKTVAWYDNEMSYTAQLVRVLNYLAKI